MVQQQQQYVMLRVAPRGRRFIGIMPMRRHRHALHSTRTRYASVDVAKLSHHMECTTRGLVASPAGSVVASCGGDFAASTDRGGVGRGVCASRVVATVQVQYERVRAGFLRNWNLPQSVRVTLRRANPTGKPVGYISTVLAAWMAAMSSVTFTSTSICYSYEYSYLFRCTSTYDFPYPSEAWDEGLSPRHA